MMKLVVPVLTVAVVLSFLISSAVEESSKKIVTVRELLLDAGRDGFSGKERVRLGARVASDDIQVTSEPVRQVSFFIRDIEGSPEDVLRVEYQGLMPDTLREGRDVILEGDFNGAVFAASTLNTQCPSKYEPPDPTAGNSKTSY
jgi:cytochrome c-type biogenesis protein CcmE